MNRIAYRYDDGERCEAAPLSIFETKLELKLDEPSDVNPVAWSTSPDFINAKLLKQASLLQRALMKATISGHLGQASLCTSSTIHLAQTSLRKLLSRAVC